MPAFAELHRTYSAKGLAVVGVSLDILYENLKGPAEAWSRVTPFLKSRGIPYTILMGEDATSKDYKIEAMPVTLLLDKKGRVATKYVGIVDVGDVESNVKALLRE